MARLICENCEHGYAPVLTVCPWCGCSATLAHTDHTDSCFDTECYINYWLCKFDTGETFHFFPGHPLDIPGLRRTLSRCRLIGFNSIKYDLPIIALALAGFDNAQLKQASDMMIVQGVKHWDMLKQYGIGEIDWVDHVDLFEVAPGQGSLKAYGGKMHSRKLQDLPIDPSATIDWFGRMQLNEYCGNDLRTTRDLLETFPAQITLREEMSEEYGVDLRSKSDAQIAEAVMKSLLPFKVERPYIAPGTTFHYQPPAWLSFRTPLLNNVLCDIVQAAYSVTPTGGVSPAFSNHYVDWGTDQVRLDVHGNFIKRPADWKHKTIRIGGTDYALGNGGLHSQESQQTWRASDTHSLRSPDVASYYPSLIVRLGIIPAQIGHLFQTYYAGWKQSRLEAKRAGIKKRANSLKTLLNGTFGKLGSKWSIFYAPSEMIQVTVTGQLALLMLIEELESAGISVISANTDGIVMYAPRALDCVADSIIAWWERTTGFEMEMTEFKLLAARDVNSFVALTTDNEVKLKGAFAPPEPGASGWPNPTGQVCVDAVIAYLRDGTPLEQTILACTDIRQFVYVRQVKGGGSYCPDGTLDRKATQKHMREVLGVPDMGKDELLVAWSARCDQEAATRQYLGKIVRWYYAAGSRGCIVTPAGGLVPRTDGCRPLMELPDVLPLDVDYNWYIAEARSLLADVGLTV